MCVISFIGQQYHDHWNQPQPVSPNLNGLTTIQLLQNQPTREEFEAIKKEVLFMKELLKKAKLYDEQTGQPDCSMEEKVTVLKKVAELVGVSLEEIFKKN